MISGTRLYLMRMPTAWENLLDKTFSAGQIIFILGGLGVDTRIAKSEWHENMQHSLDTQSCHASPTAAYADTCTN